MDRSARRIARLAVQLRPALRLTDAVLLALADGPATVGDLWRILDGYPAPIPTVLRSLVRQGRVVLVADHPYRWALP